MIPQTYCTELMSGIFLVIWDNSDIKISISCQIYEGQMFILNEKESVTQSSGESCPLGVVELLSTKNLPQD